MEQQGDTVQNTSAEENMETLPTVPISEEVRPTEDRDTTNSGMDKDNPIPNELLVEMFRDIIKEIKKWDSMNNK